MERLMTSIEHIAGEFLADYLDQLPEFLDLTEFIHENYYDLSTETGDIYNEVYEKVLLGMNALRVHFYEEIYDVQ
jgi:hypothetical protein